MVNASTTVLSRNATIPWASTPAPRLGHDQHVRDLRGHAYDERVVDEFPRAGLVGARESETTRDVQTDAGAIGIASSMAQLTTMPEPRATVLPSVRVATGPLAVSVTITDRR